METYILAIVNKLDANSLLLLLTLLGGWKLIVKFMDNFKEHGEKMTDSLESIAKDTSELRKDMSIIAARVELHEERIDRLESK